MDNSKRASSLKVHEWAAVVLLIAATIFVFLVTRNNANTTKFPQNQPKNTHEVIVKGAVAHEGVYRVPLETTVGELLALSAALPTADLRRYKLEARIKKGRVLNVRVRKVITVHVSGAVAEPGSVEMFPSDRYADLRKKIVLLSGADDTVFKKRGVLKNNQKIEVPFRPEKKR